MRVLTCLVVFLCCRPAFAERAPILRQGFTAGLSLGGGGAVLTVDEATKHQFGLGGLNLEIGGFVAPNVALLFKVAGVNYGPFDDRLTLGLAESFGPAVQMWFGDRLNLTAGLGIGFMTEQPRDGIQTQHLGAGLMLTLAVLPLALAHHGLGLALDIEPVFALNATAMAYQIGLTWQYY